MRKAQSMQSRQPEKIYIDTNVWFSYITRGVYDSHFEKAQTIIDDVNKNNEHIAIISHLSLLELVNSIRNGVIRKAEYQGKLNENTDIEFDLKNRIDHYIKDVMDIITKWEASGKLQIVDVKTPLTQILKQTQLLQRKTFGSINDSDTCMTCKSKHYGYYYRGVDHWDIQHALIAKEGKVNTFVTFDRGFNKLKQYFNNDYEIRVK
jgi:predicted nucleic acid-binding protein